MHITVLSPSAFFFAAAVSAGVIAERQRPDPHRSDFRTFGSDSCNEPNYGVATLTLSQTNRCYKFPDQEEYPVESVFINNTESGCTCEFKACPLALLVTLTWTGSCPVRGIGLLRGGNGASCQGMSSDES